MKNRCKGKSNQGGREGAAENHDSGVRVQEHPKIAAHQNQGGKDAGSGKKTERRCDIHEIPRPKCCAIPGGAKAT
jgi:hypothetical protein